VTTSTPVLAVASVRRRRTRRRYAARRWGVNLLFAAPGAVLIAVISLYPMGILVVMAFSKVNISNFLGAWPAAGFDNFITVFSAKEFQSVALQTCAFVAGVVILTMGLGLLIAVALKRSQGFSLVTQTTLILIWTLPGLIIGSLWKFLLSSDGFVNGVLMGIGILDRPIPFLSQPQTALIGVAAVTIWVGLPFSSLVIKSAILDVPEDVLDAARVDGANSRQTLFRIILPMIRPTLLILGVLSVVGAFKAFDLIFIMTSGGPGTSSATIPFLGYLLAFQQYHFGESAAISVVAMAIVLALAGFYLFAMRKEEKR
jgi:multiple sugar transport system permease protein